MKTDVQFVEAKKMAPAQFELDAIGPGDCVKVQAVNKGKMAERFWVRVTAVDNETINGRINNNLMIIPLDYMEPITFQKAHVWNIAV